MTLLPPEATISKQEMWHTRWRVKAPYFDERAKGYVAGDVRSEYESLMQCLSWIWSEWVNLSGEECPYRFDDGVGS